MTSSPTRRRRAVPTATALAACLLLALASLAACDLGGAGSAAVAGAVAAPAAGTRDLDRDERLGGHTLARHVGKTDEFLRERLRRDRHLAVVSTYTDRATAERVVAETLARGGKRLEAWQARSGARPNLVLDYRGDPARPIGRCLRRGDRRVRPAADARVVLKWREDAGSFVLTSYPEVRP